MIKGVVTRPCSSYLYINYREQNRKPRLSDRKIVPRMEMAKYFKVVTAMKSRVVYITARLLPAHSKARILHHHVNAVLYQSASDRDA
jgi:hypothetical protein